MAVIDYYKRFGGFTPTIEEEPTGLKPTGLKPKQDVFSGGLQVKGSVTTPTTGLQTGIPVKDLGMGVEKDVTVTRDFPNIPEEKENQIKMLVDKKYPTFTPEQKTERSRILSEKFVEKQKQPTDIQVKLKQMYEEDPKIKEYVNWMVDVARQNKDHPDMAGIDFSGSDNDVLLQLTKDPKFEGVFGNLESGFEERQKPQRLPGNLMAEDPFEMKEVPFKYKEGEVSNIPFVGAFTTVAKGIGNIPTAVLNDAKRLANSLVNPRTASEQIEQLPGALKDTIKKELYSDKPVLELVKDTVDAIIKFGVENPDVALPSLKGKFNFKKFITEVPGKGKKFVKETVTLEGQQAKIIRKLEEPKGKKKLEKAENKIESIKQEVAPLDKDILKKEGFSKKVADQEFDKLAKELVDKQPTFKSIKDDMGKGLKEEGSKLEKVLTDSNVTYKKGEAFPKTKPDRIQQVLDNLREAYDGPGNEAKRNKIIELDVAYENGKLTAKDLNDLKIQYSEEGLFSTAGKELTSTKAGGRQVIRKDIKELLEKGVPEVKVINESIAGKKVLAEGIFKQYYKTLGAGEDAITGLRKALVDAENKITPFRDIQLLKGLDKSGVSKVKKLERDLGLKFKDYLENKGLLESYKQLKQQGLKRKSKVKTPKPITPKRKPLEGKVGLEVPEEVKSRRLQRDKFVENITKKENVKDLVALHNLSVEKLRKIKDLGGLPGPSVAITKKSIPFEDFGDITLVGNKKLITGPKSDIYSADIYSPRVPEPSIILKKGISKELDILSKESGVESWKLQDILEQGNGEIPRWAVLNNPGLNKIKDKVGNLMDKKLFKGFTYGGTKRYKEYTLDNVLKDMFSKGTKGSESGMFEGTLKQMVGKDAKKYTDIEKIRKEIKFSEKTEVLEKSYKELESKYNGILEDISNKSNKSMFELGSIISDDLKKGLSNESIVSNIKEFGVKSTSDQIGKLKSIIQTTGDLPKSYIEAKIKRGVGLGEFEAVLVPQSQMAEVKGILKGTPLENKIVGYTEGLQKRGSKLNEINKKYGNVFFSMGGSMIPAGYILYQLMQD